MEDSMIHMLTELLATLRLQDTLMQTLQQDVLRLSRLMVDATHVLAELTVKVQRLEEQQ